MVLISAKIIKDKGNVFYGKKPFRGENTNTVYGVNYYQLLVLMQVMQLAQLVVNF